MVWVISVKTSIPTTFYFKKCPRNIDFLNTELWQALCLAGTNFEMTLHALPFLTGSQSTKGMGMMVG